MRQPSETADQVIATTLRQQAGLITRAQLLTAGWTEATLRYRTRVGGPWRAVLPGVYLNHGGPLAAGQRELAAALYVGHQCVITGQAALFHYGIRAPLTETVDVLISDVTKVQSAGFVRTHRTRRMPEQPRIYNGVRWASPVRAVADAARGDLALSDVRALVADAVQRSNCSVKSLAEELRAGPAQHSGALRLVLEEVADGVASVAEGDLRKLIKSGRLPEPMYNPKLYVADEFLAQPDLWWRDAGVAGEVDSREWHISPELWARTLARHAKMTAHGIYVLHFTPGRVRSDGQRVLAELRSAIEKGAQRPPLPIKAIPGQ